jgi:hypothetical protein
MARDFTAQTAGLTMLSARRPGAWPVEGEVGHQLLELGLLVLELLEPADLRDAHPGVLLLLP